MESIYQPKLIKYLDVILSIIVASSPVSVLFSFDNAYSIDISTHKLVAGSSIGIPFNIMTLITIFVLVFDIVAIIGLELLLKVAYSYMYVSMALSALSVVYQLYLGTVFFPFLRLNPSYIFAVYRDIIGLVLVVPVVLLTWKLRKLDQEGKL